MSWFRTFIVAMLLIAPAAADDHFMIVLDTSNSMREVMRSDRRLTKWDTATKALLDVLSKVPPTTKVGIITFERVVYEIQPVDMNKLETIIGNLQPAGVTPLFATMKKATSLLLEERQKNNNVGYYKLIVVTDGDASENDLPLNQPSRFSDGSVKKGVLADILSRGIIVDTIAVDFKNEQHSLRYSINGTYMKGDDPKSLTKAITKAVAEVGVGDPKASAEAFEVIAGLPESFAEAAVKGITTFENHPIGEKPKVIEPPPPAVETSLTSPVSTRPVAAAAVDGSSHFGLIACLIGGLALGFLMILFIARNL